MELAARAGDKFREAPNAAIAIDYGDVGNDPISRLIEELGKVGAHTVSVHSLDQLQSAIRSIIEQYVVRSVLLNSSGIIAPLKIGDILRASGVQVVEPEHLGNLAEADRRDRLFEVQLGMAAPDWAIAETGTLVYAASREQTRSATLLPPIHVAIVDAACVLRDLLDLPNRLQQLPGTDVLSRNVALVTGPSKTGDIELKLTTGVHGPGEVHVIIWNATQESAGAISGEPPNAVKSGH